MDSLFFWISKLVWIFVSPDSLILIILLTALVFLFAGKQKLARYLLAAVSALLVVIAFFPVGEWLLYPLETRFDHNPVLPKKIDGVIVLSGAEDPVLTDLWGQVELGEAAERDLAFMALARKNPGAKLIFTGGSGSLLDPDYRAADVAKILFRQQGLDITRIIFERESRNTYENVIFSKKLAQPKTNENWVVITTAWHMPRSVGIFCRAGWPVMAYPVDHHTAKGKVLRIQFNLAANLNKLKIGIKEWLGLVAYRLSDKTDSLLPSACQA